MNRKRILQRVNISEDNTRRTVFDVYAELDYDNVTPILRITIKKSNYKREDRVRFDIKRFKFEKCSNQVKDRSIYASILNEDGRCFALNSDIEDIIKWIRVTLTKRGCVNIELGEDKDIEIANEMIAKLTKEVG